MWMINYTSEFLYTKTKINFKTKFDILIYLLSRAHHEQGVLTDRDILNGH